MTVGAALAASETLVRRHVLPTDSFDQARIVFRTPGPNVAAFGDSRVNDGVMRTVDIANFAMPGDSLATVLGKLEAWLVKNPDGKAIVGVPPQQFSQARIHANQEKLLTDFLSDEDPWLHTLRPNYRRYLISYVRTVIDDPGLLLRAPLDMSQTAGTPMTFADLSADQRRTRAEIRSQHHTPVPGFQNSALASALRDRLQALSDAGAELCLVTMPVSKAYQAAVASEPSFAGARTLVSDIADEMGIPYADLWSDYPDDVFANADHLAPEGAIRATRDLLQSCFGMTSMTTSQSMSRP